MGADFKHYLNLAASGRAFSQTEMKGAMTALLTENLSDVEIAGFLMALRVRGPTVEELAAAVEAMRAIALRVEAPDNVIDTCGTGGDGADTFNISTATAFIVAGAGVPVAKHGSTAASSRSGSAEVLRALGVKLEIPPAQISKCIKEAGVGFMFAQIHHSAAKKVASARKQLGVRTLFNILGPLSNPASAKMQLMGVYDRSLLRPAVEAMKRLGVKSAWVVNGADGLDELTTTGPTYVAALKNGEVEEFKVTPEDAGLPRAPLSDLKGGDPSFNAQAIRELLDGRKGAFRDISIYNASAALVIADKVKTLEEGAKMAAAAIDDHRAKSAMENLVRISNEPL